MKNELYNYDKIIIVNAFGYILVHEILNDDYKPRLITKCHQMQDWPRWEEAI